MAIGSPLSPVVPNIFMEDFRVHCHHYSKPPTQNFMPLRGWYLCRLGTWKTSPPGFLEHINGLHERTMEVEENNKISFPDVLVERKSHSASTSVYRKPTHTDRYLNYRSHHHPKTKTGIISCLKSRAENICMEEESKTDEVNKLEDVFIVHGNTHKHAALHVKPQPTLSENSNND